MVQYRTISNYWKTNHDTTKYFFQRPYPSIASYWDVQQCSCLLDDLHQALRVFSTGEKVMAQFFMLVWLGQKEAGVNLGENDLCPIATWLADPFFP